MKILTFILSLGLLFGLISCDKNAEMQQEKHVMPMQHLTMLLEHGISMMAQGAALKLNGQKHGDEMLKQSADLLRRAMSGPEMAAMHKGGQGESPAMQHTHDLGAAAFDLLDMMMSLEADQAPKNVSMLHHALNMVAQGASMKSLAGMGMSKEIDASMQKHAQMMQQGANDLSHVPGSMTAYQQAVLKVIGLLAEDGTNATKHMH